MANMARVTQQNAAMVEQNTAAARSPAEEARRLTALVHRFHLGDEDRLRAAASAWRAVPPSIRPGLTRSPHHTAPECAQLAASDSSHRSAGRHLKREERAARK